MDIFMFFTKYSLATLLVIPSIMIYIFLYIRRSKRSFKVVPKLPPSPPKLPVIGNLHQILGKPRHVALWNLSKRYGPIMQIHIGSKPFLIISSPAMAKQILKTQDHIFCSRVLFKAAKRLTYNFKDVALSPHSGHWKEMRKLLVSEFIGPKRAKLSNHVLVIEMECLNRSLSLQPPNTMVNLSKMLSEVVKQMVCKVAFGKNYKEQLVKGSSWEVVLWEILELLNGSIGDSFPYLGFFIDHFSGWNHRLSNGFKHLDAYIDTIIDDHLKDYTEEMAEEDKDFVHTLLGMSSKEYASRYRLNNEDIKALVMDILIGGIETTALTMIWAMTEITRDTRVMQKLQSELRNCTGRIENVGELETTKMTYLKMVVKETLRLHTPVPLLVPHLSLSHTRVEGYDVFPNTTVLINAWGIARDPSIWGENAAKFYPERFENIDGDFGRDRFEMFPFGGGRRSCPGMNIAPANVEFVIANLLYWFDWEFPSEINGEGLNMEDEGSLVCRKKAPFFLVPTKHKWED